MNSAEHTRDRQGWVAALLGVALVSMSLLILEVGLTRIFSVMFEFHYGFLVISLAILGLGAGGIFVQIRPGKTWNLNPKPSQTLLPISSGLMALSILGMTIILVEVSLFQNIFFAASLAFAPFFFGGIFLATAFRLFTNWSPQVYAADLIGASIGSLLSLFLLKLDGINVNFLLVVIAFFPAVLLSCGKSTANLRKATLLLLMLAPLSIFFLNYLYGFVGPIPFARGAHKEMGHFLASPESKASVLESRWSAFGRTDLVADEEAPDEMTFFVDGGAGAGVYRFDGDPASLEGLGLRDFSGYFPLKLLPQKEKEKVLIIGSGGGREVLASLLAGAKQITAVEVNTDLVDLMKKYSDFNGGIYNGFPGVKVVVEEGRNFIRATKEKYDIIMLSLPITKTSRSPEGFSLTENFLFTVDSIRDYLDRLKTDGRLIVVAHDDMEIFRLITITLSALKKRGISPASAKNHFYSVGLEDLPVFVLKKSPLTRQEAQDVHRSMHEYNHSSLPTFIPYVDQKVHRIPLIEGIFYDHYMLSQALDLMLRGDLPQEAIVKLADFDLKRVTDDNPFFYKFHIGLPSVIIFLLAFSSVAIVGGWFFGAGSTKGVPKRNDIPFLLFFSFLGIGFMLIEIPLFQKFILFLGQPVYSMAMLLFSILIGAGIGSWVSGIFWCGRALLKIRLAAMMVGFTVMTYTLFLKQVFEFFLGTPFLTRILVSFLLLMPLGFFMGMPFPLGMKLLDELGLEQDVPRMWGVNGIGSVLGSTLAIALAISFGFSYSMIIGASLYFLIFIFLSAVLLYAKFESR